MSAAKKTALKPPAREAIPPKDPSKDVRGPAHDTGRDRSTGNNRRSGSAVPRKRDA